MLWQLTKANFAGRGSSAAGAVRVYDDDPKASGIDPGTEAGAEQVIQYALTAVTILRTKAEPADAAAYRRFLLVVTDGVITGLRNELLGIGGLQIHPTERDFRERLAAITRPTPPPSLNFARKTNLLGNADPPVGHPRASGPTR